MSGPVVLALRALLAVSLYAFLAWAFINLWQDIRQQGALLASRRVPSISLSITTPRSAPQVYHFNQPEITIGRDAACECAVDNDTVSARHTRLSYHHNQWWLEDLGSTNGTLLNSEKVTMPTVVVSNDVFSCGETSITILLNSETINPPMQEIAKNRGRIPE